MKYVLEVDDDYELRLEMFKENDDLVCIKICDMNYGCKPIYLDSDQLFQVIVVLSHLRKQIEE